MNTATEAGELTQDSKTELLEYWVRFAYTNGFKAQGFLTLTFDRNRGKITQDRALWEWRYLVQRLNQLHGGVNYRNKWGHSYFGYILGVERHKDGVFHAHAVVDNWISFSMVHEVWNDRCGFAWTKIVDDDFEATRYVLKYCLKSEMEKTYYFTRAKRVVNPQTGTISRAVAAS